MKPVLHPPTGLTADFSPLNHRDTRNRHTFFYWRFVRIQNVSKRQNKNSVMSLERHELDAMVIMIITAREPPPPLVQPIISSLQTSVSVLWRGLLGLLTVSCARVAPLATLSLSTATNCLCTRRPRRVKPRRSTW